MKNTILILLFLLPITLMAQEDAFGPQKNDNLIIVTTDTVDRSALNKAAKSLTDMGFTIKEKSIETGSITTDTYDFKRGKLTLRVLFTLNEIKISGDFETNLSLISGGNKPNPIKGKIAFEGIKGSAVKEAWNIMDAYANDLTTALKGVVSYSKF